MTQDHPTPVPGAVLTAETARLLVKGDVLRHERGPVGVFKGLTETHLYMGRAGLPNIGDYHTGFTFIGRSSSDGFIPWSGGENPVGDALVDADLGFAHIVNSRASLLGKAWQDKGRFRLSRPEAALPLGGHHGRPVSESEAAGFVECLAEAAQAESGDHIADAGKMVPALSAPQPSEDGPRHEAMGDKDGLCACDEFARQSAEIARLRGALEKAKAEALRYAEFYPQSSDGRNTFVIFADFIDRLAPEGAE